MITIKKWVSPKVLVSGLLAAGLSFGAAAGEAGQGLKKWQKQASQQLSDVMQSKRYSLRQEPDGNIVFEATIDADGEVTEFDRLYRDGNYHAKRAGTRLLKDIELPDLPDDFSEIRVRVVLQYGVTASRQFNMERFNRNRGIVTTRELSENTVAPTGLKVISTTAR